MIYGLGTDIVEVARFDRDAAKLRQFAARVLTTTEQQQMACSAHPSRFLAKRFAVKEAAVKAFGTGIAQGVSFQHIQIEHKPSGQPFLVFNGKLAKLCRQYRLSSHVSLSDEKHYAVATVVLEQPDKTHFTARGKNSRFVKADRNNTKARRLSLW
jgi:holo-[acyl-carrier protein] synthase